VRWDRGVSSGTFLQRLFSKPPSGSLTASGNYEEMVGDLVEWVAGWSPREPRDDVDARARDFFRGERMLTWDEAVERAADS
jgi:hypothetical protein